jgi:TfoX/Sxy family transcriptional regulator of competence genes
MKFDKSPAWLAELFRALQPEAGGELKVMFSYPAAFANGYLYSGLFGATVFVQLDEKLGNELLGLGGKPFDPMQRGAAFRKYVVLPDSMLDDEEEVLRWMRRAFAYVMSLPAKVKKPRKPRKPASSSGARKKSK